MKTWEALGFLSFFATFSFAVNLQDEILAGTNLGVYRSVDNGGNWAATSLTRSNLVVTDLAINSNGDIFAATVDGRNQVSVFRSTDNGENWLPVNQGLDGSIIDALGVNQKGDIFAASRGSGIFLSTDNGATWTKTSIPNVEVRTFAINHRGYVFAGTSDGIFISIDDGNTWSRSNEGLTNTDILSTAIDNKGHTLAGTHGSGVFRTLEVRSW